MSKKILILLMTCNSQERFTAEEEGIKRLWAKRIVEGQDEDVKLYFYSGGYDKTEIVEEKNEIHINAPDDWDGTYEKSIAALKLTYAMDYDVLIRSNTTTFLNMPLIKHMLDKDFDENYIYGPHLLVNERSEYIPFFRGNILILSKKVVNDIIEAYDKYQLKGVDDATLGLSLYKLYNERGESYFSKLKQLTGINSPVRQEIVDFGKQAFYFRYRRFERPELHIQDCETISNFYAQQKELLYVPPTEPQILELPFGQFKI